jgi:hypothetical protein
VSGAESRGGFIVTLKNVEADAPKRKHRLDPPRDGIEAYRNVVNVVNAVNAMETLLTTTSPDVDKPQRAAAAWVAVCDRTRRGAA